MVKLSTRARYGTRVLLELALRWGQGPVQLKSIARNQEVSVLYLEHVIKPLMVAGLIKSMRGARGGIWLAKAPSEIKLSEVIRALEGSTDLIGCLDSPSSCPRSNFCIARDFWGEFKRAMDRVLESTTLQVLIERYSRKECAADKMYYI